MTRRLTISVPDDIAERIDREPNASAFIADLVRKKTRNEAFIAYLKEEMGVTDEGMARAREWRLRSRKAADTPEMRAQREAARIRIAAARARYRSTGDEA
jgi:hypothetical protein